MKPSAIAVRSYKVCTGKSDIKELMEENARIHANIQAIGYGIILRCNRIILNSRKRKPKI